MGLHLENSRRKNVSLRRIDRSTELLGRAQRGTHLPPLGPVPTPRAAATTCKPRGHQAEQRVAELGSSRLRAQQPTEAQRSRGQASQGQCARSLQATGLLQMQPCRLLSSCPWTSVRNLVCKMQGSDRGCPRLTSGLTGQLKSSPHTLWKTIVPIREFCQLFPKNLFFNSRLS